MPDQAIVDVRPPPLITHPPDCPLCRGRGLIDDIPCWRCVAGQAYLRDPKPADP